MYKKCQRRYTKKTPQRTWFFHKMSFLIPFFFLSIYRPNDFRHVLHTFVWLWWDSNLIHILSFLLWFLSILREKASLCLCAIKRVFFMLFRKFKKYFNKFNPLKMHSHLCSVNFFNFIFQPICPTYMEWPYNPLPYFITSK